MNKKPKQIILFITTVAIAIAITGCARIASNDLINGPDPILYIAVDAANSDVVFIKSTQLETPIKQTNLVIFTHGWFDVEGWPRDSAASLHRRLPDDTWAVGWFDWRGDTTKVLPTEVAYYGKFKSGPILGDEMLRLTKDYQHVHLIGHSCGTWIINEAARKIASQTSANIHLTFLDAFVPILWNASELGDIKMSGDTIFWSDHYLNYDIDTLSQTELTLKNAHNVDVTLADPDMRDHDFVWNWYWATVKTSFDTSPEYPGATLYHTAAGIEYGHARSLEAGLYPWPQNITDFPHGNEPIKIDAPKKEFKLPLQGVLENIIPKDVL